MIKSRIVKQQKVRWRELQWFQTPNFKDMSRKDMDKLKASLKNNDFIFPFMIWDDGKTLWILDGHHRQRAMQELIAEGVTIDDAMPANYVECKSRKDAAKLVAIYSSIYAKVSKKGFLDFVENFELELQELSFEIDMPSFDIDKLSSTTIDEEWLDEKEEEDVPKNPICAAGDIWELGNHRLICGDSLNDEVLAQLMQGNKATMVFTDPPYNVSMDFISVVQKEDGRWNEFDMASGEMSIAQFIVFLRRTFEKLCLHSVPGSIHYVCMDWRHSQELLSAALECYSEWKQLVVWNKNQGGMGTFYRSKHELIFVFKNGDEPHINNFELGQHGRYRTNVWDYESAKSFSVRNSATEGGLSLHPTVKPVKMVADAMLDCSNKGDIILDLFGGSGTTLIAAEKTGRIAYMSEISTDYCDVIIRRYVGHCKESHKKNIIIKRNGVEVDGRDLE